MKTDKRNQPLFTKHCNQTAICPPTFLTRLMTVATCLLLCLASCGSEESDTLPDGGDYPPTGKRIPLRVAGAGMASYATSTAGTRSSGLDGGLDGLTSIWVPQTRASTSAMPTGALFWLYVYTKDLSTSNYSFTCSYACRIRDTGIQCSAYYYEGSTIRIIAVWNGASSEYDKRLTLDEYNHIVGQFENTMPRSPAWGSPYPVDLSKGANFMVYDSGDINTKTYLDPIQIMFRYYTSQIVVFLPHLTDAKEMKGYQEYALATQGTWNVGDPYITESARFEGDAQPPKSDNLEATSIYTDAKYSSITQGYGLSDNCPYIEYPVISLDTRGFSTAEFPLLIVKLFINGLSSEMWITCKPDGPRNFEKGKLYPYIAG